MFQDQTIADKRIFMDGKAFDGCTFNNCLLVVSGYIPFTINECTFRECEWAFQGPASLTIEIMATLYQAGAKNLIENTCNKIMGKGPPDPTRQ